MNDNDAAEPETANGPTAAEVEAWARRERKRREAWLNGPTEEEKAAWARRRARLRAQATMDDDVDLDDPDVERAVRQFRRLAQVGQRGLVTLAFGWPFLLMEQVLRAGLAAEDEPIRTRRRRIVLEDD